MTILEIIRHEKDRFIAAGNPQPEIIYLGREEHARAREAAREWISIPSECKNESERAECLGMKVYKVDADNFVAFGLQQPSPCG